MADEKHITLLPPPVGKRTQKPTTIVRKLVAGVLLTVAIGWSLSTRYYGVFQREKSHDVAATHCPQVAPLFPEQSSLKLKAMEAFIATETFRNHSIQRLSDIVKIPSISYDHMGSPQDDRRFDIFYEIEDYLKITYPLLHSKLRKELVNVHGLLYTWEGSDSSLKPTLLMAHQDVVPVEESTIDTWTHPPFSGYYDGKFIWGRGSSDCKNQLTAVMETVELLLAADFKPKRTILLSFGFDEEVSGLRGAGHLAPHILNRYGKNSIATIVDEGAGVTEAWGELYAAPAVGEKGYTDVKITVRMPGGHSSIPSPHTSIGVLSHFITLIEAETYSPRLDDNNPYLGVLQCGAKYSPEFPSKLRKLLHTRSQAKTCHKSADPLAEAAAKEGLPQRYLMQTSQAVDLISGGAKINALPEIVSATVNHRINIGESSHVVYEKLMGLAKKVAKKYSLDVHAFDGIEARNSINLSASNTTLEPAPVTPTNNHLNSGELSAYGILSGSTRAIYGERLNMAPGLSTGNTDTRYYWDLTKNIFRYGPGYEAGETGLGNIHTVDERQSVAGHINAVKWFTTFVRNMDEAGMD